jgi:hypothetical protein
LVGVLETCGFDRASLRHVSSHSLKATWLTALGKFGTPLEERQLLGYHVIKGAASAQNYNRDNLATPIRSLTAVVALVVSGHFVPDAPRAERILPLGRAPVCLEKQVENTLGTSVKNIVEKLIGRGDVPPPYPQDEDGSSRVVQAACVESSGALSDVETFPFEAGASGDDLPHTTDSDVESSAAVPAAVSPDEDLEASMREAARLTAGGGRSARCVPPSADVDAVVRHLARKTVHFRHLVDDDKLACGRPFADERYEEIAAPTDALWPKCKDCFPGQ